MKEKVLSTQLTKEFSSVLFPYRDEKNYFYDISSVEKYSTDKDLVFISDRNSLKKVISQPPAVTIIADSLSSDKIGLPANGSVFFSKNLRLAHSLIKKKYKDFLFTANGWPKIHNKAVIHAEAQLAADVQVGPLAVIGKRCRIAAKVFIGAGATIEDNVEIGENSKILNQVFIGSDTIIGKNVIIKPQAVIGIEGFGFAQDDESNHYRLPQTGHVVIEDNVVVGALNTIDRGTYRPTIIGRGVILDSHVHIAHNTIIGKNSLIAAQTGIAGSAVIGERVKMSGQSGVLDHVKISDDITMVHRALATRDLKEKDVYAYHPIMKLGNALKAEKIVTELPRLKKKIIELLNLLGINTK